MISRCRLVAFGVVLVIVLTGAACRLQRPEIQPTRMIEPRLPATAAEVADAPTAAAVRLLETHARAHLGRPLLHLLAGDELTVDPIWRWTSSPDRYLDSAMRFTAAVDPEVRLVDTSSAPALAATVLTWRLESAGSRQLVGAVEVQVIGADRVVHTDLIRGSEPVSMELPGDLAEAAGRLLQRLAADSLARATRLAAAGKR